MEKIILLHTNDVHSHLENWPKIRRFLLEQQQKEPNVLTLDLGDFVDRSHPLTEATNGKANVQLLNQAKYDAVTIGNNEGVANSKTELNELYTEAKFDVVLDNLFDKTTLQAPAWAQAAKIFTTKNGTKIGLLACTAPFPRTYGPNGWDVRQPMDVLPALVKKLRSEVHVLVLLSHLGINTDRMLAQELPEIDVILGAHTHHLLEHGEKIGSVQLAAAGKFGYYVGEVQLTVDENHRITATSATTVATRELPEAPEDAAEIEGYLAEGHRLLSERKIARVPFTLSADIRAPHPVIDLTLKAVKEKAQTEVAILNTGLFLHDIPAGLVSQDQLHTVLPHPMRLLKVTLKGRDVTRLILEMEKNRSFLINFPILGMGFRGKVFGHIVYEGLVYDAGAREVYWLGKPVRPEAVYTLATVDHFMFVPFFPTIELAGDTEFLVPEFLRDVLGQYLHKNYPIT